MNIKPKAIPDNILTADSYYGDWCGAAEGFDMKRRGIAARSIILHSDCDAVLWG